MLEMVSSIDETCWVSPPISLRPTVCDLSAFLLSMSFQKRNSIFFSNKKIEPQKVSAFFKFHRAFLWNNPSFFDFSFNQSVVNKSRNIPEAGYQRVLLLVRFFYFFRCPLFWSRNNIRHVTCGTA